MSYYRLYYRRGGPGGPISGVDEIDARDDVEAAALAARQAGDHVMELWCGTRRIRSYLPAETAACLVEAD